MFICEISIIITLICQKLWSVGLVQWKIKLPSPYVVSDFKERFPQKLNHKVRDKVNLVFKLVKANLGKFAVTLFISPSVLHLYLYYNLLLYSK